LGGEGCICWDRDQTRWKAFSVGTVAWFSHDFLLYQREGPKGIKLSRGQLQVHEAISDWRGFGPCGVAHVESALDKRAILAANELSRRVCVAAVDVGAFGCVGEACAALAVFATQQSATVDTIVGVFAVETLLAALAILATLALYEIHAVGRVGVRKSDESRATSARQHFRFC
jgi:hypothetical protein